MGQAVCLAQRVPARLPAGAHRRGLGGDRRRTGRPLARAALWRLVRRHRVRPHRRRAGQGLACGVGLARGLSVDTAGPRREREPVAEDERPTVVPPAREPAAPGVSIRYRRRPVSGSTPTYTRARKRPDGELLEVSARTSTPGRHGMRGCRARILQCAPGSVLVQDIGDTCLQTLATRVSGHRRHWW